MALNKLQKLAGVSAVALGVAVAASDSWSATYTAGSGNPFTVTVNATIDNAIEVTLTTAPSFGTIGVTSDPADTATLVMAPDGTMTDDTAGPARLIHSTGTGTPGVIDITGAFADTELFVDFGNAVDLNCGGCAAGTPDLILADATTDLTTPGNLAGPTTGSGTTDPSGNLSFNIGVSIATDPSANPYEDNTYAGSFDLFFGY